MDTIRINDLVCAAYLNHKGCVHSSKEMQGRKCIWVFADSKTARNTVDEFNEEETFVDLPRFVSTYLDVRQDMFRFLKGEGVLDDHQTRPSRRA